MDYEVDEINESFDQSMSISEGDKSIEIIQNEDILENIFENFDTNINPNEGILIEESENFEDIFEESEVKANYPNEAYADLMTLVTKYNLSNKTGNAIIKFFNKHSNLNTSPLPKSIKKGRKYMDNMNIPNFEFDKTLVINYNNNDYYLHHRSLINCIKSILSIHNILQSFVLSFEKLEVIILVYVDLY